MKARAYVLGLALFAIAVTGCAAAHRAYVFSPPSFDQRQWTLVYPANRDEQKVKCVATKDDTGAVIRFEEDPYQGPTARDTALAYRIKMRNRGDEVGELATREDANGKYASFGFVAKNGLHGKVVAVRRPGVTRTIALVGAWPATHAAKAAGDIERLASELDVTQSVN